MIRISAAVVSMAILLLAAPAQAEGPSSHPIKVERPWARASIGTLRPAAAYMTLHNMGAEADFLVGIKTPAAALAEVHKTSIEKGIARMAAVGRMELPPDSEIKLEPGGLHVMLMELSAALNKGDELSLVLEFETADDLEVKIPVLATTAKGPEK